jgi:lipoprotein-anchoring transpeptidase ErfK/SrfK
LKRIISFDWWRHSGLFFAGVALSVTTLGVWVAPALTTPGRDSIAKKIQALQASQERWIQVNLKTQRLVAWEGKNPVYAIVISSGKDSTPTYPGIFKIQSKYATTRMKGAGYDIPNVPYAMYYEGNYGIHGAFWHRSFGTPVSHGCVNVAVNHARWLFDWASVGTAVVITR